MLSYCAVYTASYIYFREVHALYDVLVTLSRPAISTPARHSQGRSAFMPRADSAVRYFIMNIFENRTTAAEP